jgi:hypothetical protein
METAPRNKIIGPNDLWDHKPKVRTRTKFALGFGVTGFLIGIALCAYTFFMTSSRYTGGPPPISLYLFLCPASFAAMALDNAGVVGGLIGWFFISLINAALYGAIGLGLGQKVERKQV